MQEPTNRLARHSNSVTHTPDLTRGGGGGLPAPARPIPPPAEHLSELGPVEHGPDADADARAEEDGLQKVAPGWVDSAVDHQGGQEEDGQVGKDGRHDDQQDVLQGPPLLRQGAGVGGALLPQRPGQTHQAGEHDHEEDADEHGQGPSDVV